MLNKIQFTLILTFFSSFLVAQNSEFAWIFKDLTALEGSWFRPSDKGDFLEIWEMVDDSTMAGRGIRIKLEDSDTVGTEYLTLKERNGEIYYSAQVRRVNNGEPVEYKLTEAEGNTFTFENPDFDYPTKIQYVLLDRREIIVRKSGTRSSTGKDKNEEFSFQREFAPAQSSFRVFAGGNYSGLKQNGALGGNNPEFGSKPGWDVGVQYQIEGRGGFVSVGLEMRLMGLYNTTKTNPSSFFAAPNGTAIEFFRDAQYNQTWLSFAVLPTLNILKEGKLSVFAGPGFSRLLVNRASGTVLPEEDPTFKTTDDLKKGNFSLNGGLNIGLNPGKKDLDGKLSISGRLGLSDVDNLYKKVLGNQASTSGTISQWSLHVGYSINLLKI